MIDLKKLNTGETVKFRCGGEAVVRQLVIEKDIVELTLELPLKNYRIKVFYMADGKIESLISIFDIVEIIPKAFYWDDVKPGMAFDNKDSTMWFVCKYNKLWVFTDNPRILYRGKLSTFGTVKGNEYITRVPERDCADIK